MTKPFNFSTLFYPKTIFYKGLSWYNPFFCNVLLILVTGIFFCNNLYAQAFGYVDADFILKKMPNYEKTEANMQDALLKWQTEVDKMNEKANKLKSNFIAEELLLTDEMKSERQAEIKKAEEDARLYQNKVFGYNGQYFTRQTELLKPIMEEMQKAIEKVARKRKLQFIFRNSGDLSILYAEPRHDCTEDVLKELGLWEEEGKEEKKDKKK